MIPVKIVFDPIKDAKVYDERSSWCSISRRKDRTQYRYWSSNLKEQSKEISYPSAPTNFTKFPYACAWVHIGGAYTGFFMWLWWTIFISARLLEKQGTTADLWVYGRLSPDSRLDYLPTEDQKVLKPLESILCFLVTS